MKLGTVVGSLWSTKKDDTLRGMKFMLVKPVNPFSEADETIPIVAVDSIGAGIGEFVLVATGSAARIGCDAENAPIDAAIVGIIDDGSRWMQ